MSQMLKFIACEGLTFCAIWLVLTIVYSFVNLGDPMGATVIGYLLTHAWSGIKVAYQRWAD